jgi:valyl-tRNA synthetase
MVSDVATVLSSIRKAKSEAKVSMKADISDALISGPADAIARIRLAADDLIAAGRIADLRFDETGTYLTVDVTLTPEPV